jgi:hypothetical protein
MIKIFSLFVLLFLVSCSSMKGFSHLFDSTRESEKEFKVLWAKNLDPVYETGNLPISLQSPMIKDGLNLRMVGKFGRVKIVQSFIQNRLHIRIKLFMEMLMAAFTLAI